MVLVTDKEDTLLSPAHLYILTRRISIPDPFHDALPRFSYTLSMSSGMLVPLFTGDL